VVSCIWHQKYKNQKEKKKRKIVLNQNLKYLCVKGSHQEIETTTEWEKFANHVSDKALVSKTYKGFLKLNNEMTIQLENIQNLLNRYLSKENIQLDNKHIKICLTSFNTEMQIKIIIRCQFTHTEMAITKMMKDNKHWQGCGKIRTLIHYWWECKKVWLL